MKKILITFILFFSFSYANECDLYVVYNGTIFKQTSCTYVGTVPTYSYLYESVSYDSGSYHKYFSTSITNCSYNISGMQSCTYNNSYYGTYSTTPATDCVSPQTVENGECINNTPVCQFGYHNATTPAKTCIPDKECPPSMTYFAQATGTFSFDIKTCVPNRTLSPADCASAGGTMITQFDGDPNADLATLIGSGCVDGAYIVDEFSNFNRNFIVSGLLPSINSAYLAKFAQTALSGGKSVFDAIRNFFKNDPVASPQGLLTYKPEFIDLQIQSDGTYAVMDWQLRNQIWEDLTGGNVNMKPYTVTTPDVTPPNVYLGSDITLVENSLIGTKSFLDNPLPLDIPSTSPLNTVTTATIDLKNSLYGTQTTPFNVTSTLLEKSTDTAGTVITKTQSRINYPDGSATNVTTLASRVASGETTYQITATTPIQTTSGVATYSQGTIVTTNSTGAVTNTVSQLGTVSTVNPSGQVVTTPNVVKPATAPQTETGTINLANIQASLNQLNQTATATKTALQDAIDFVPTNTTAFNTKFTEFSSGLAELSLSLDNGFTFVNGLKDSLTDLETQFNDAKNIFEDKPTITLQNGTCAFTANWFHGTTTTVDPCMFIAPYRSINAIFFTLIFSFSVLMFALKYLFDVKLGGK